MSEPDARLEVDDAERPGLRRRRRAAELRAAARPQFAARVDELAPELADDLLARFGRRFDDAHVALELVYGDTHDLGVLFADCLDRVARAAAARPERLRRRDRLREIGPDWYLSEARVGYVAYADRFAGTLTGVAEHLDHLERLGADYLHLLPLLQPRPGDNDGGYSVMDYDAVDPRLGTMDDLTALADALHERGMSLCIDLVVNHTAREHAWAQRAMAGEQRYRDHYRLFADRTLPDAYEETLWEVFPHLAPGNFTWVDEVDAWVWTSFHDHQWDLNYDNPAVFAEMLDVILALANRGVDVLRLDAVPFLWKRLGTACQNLPEAHGILQAWRAFVAIAAPAVLFKAEAIVGSDDLVQYLGAHSRHRTECELAYNNQLMVQGWSALASRDARLITQAMTRMPSPPPTATWVTYVRCHDDIGWAIMDADAEAIGISGQLHREFLNAWYAGEFPGSWARGGRFGENPATRDARTSGSCASLAGLEVALEDGDPEAIELALARMRLLYALAMSWGGIPLIWSGDEFAALNDHGHLDDAALAHDNRWMHRPRLDWSLPETIDDPDAVPGRAFRQLQRLVAVRRTLPMLRGGGSVRVLRPDDTRVFAFGRDHPVHGSLLVLANVGEDEASVQAALLGELGMSDPVDALAEDGQSGRFDDRVFLSGLQVRWLVEDR